MNLGESERAVVVRWLIETAHQDAYFPGQETLFDLVSLALGSDQRYDYEDVQDEQIARWRAGEIPTAIEPLPPPPPPPMVERIGSFAFLTKSGTVLASGPITRRNGYPLAKTLAAASGTALHAVAEIGGRMFEVCLPEGGMLCMFGSFASIDFDGTPPDILESAETVSDDAPLIGDRPIAIAGLENEGGRAKTWRELPAQF